MISPLSARLGTLLGVWMVASSLLELSLALPNPTRETITTVLAKRENCEQRPGLELKEDKGWACVYTSNSYPGSLLYTYTVPQSSTRPSRGQISPERVLWDSEMNALEARDDIIEPKPMLPSETEVLVRDRGFKNIRESQRWGNFFQLRREGRIDFSQCNSWLANLHERIYNTLQAYQEPEGQAQAVIIKDFTMNNLNTDDQWTDFRVVNWDSLKFDYKLNQDRAELAKLRADQWQHIYNALPPVDTKTVDPKTGKSRLTRGLCSSQGVY